VRQEKKKNNKVKMYVQLVKKHNWFINILKFKLGLGEKNRNQGEVEG